MPAQRKVAAPVPDPESRPFWDAAKENRFLVRRCTSCGRVHWYPRTMCPFCSSTATEWEDASGKGVIYTYTVMRRSSTPYAVAYVTLEEGPTMLTNIVECDFETLHVGQAVEVVFVPTEGEDTPPVPMFRPVREKTAAS